MNPCSYQLFSNLNFWAKAAELAKKMAEEPLTPSARLTDGSGRDVRMVERVNPAEFRGGGAASHAHPYELL